MSSRDPYRDELAAAHARIANLEEELATARDEIARARQRSRRAVRDKRRSPPEVVERGARDLEEEVATLRANRSELMASAEPGRLWSRSVRHALLALVVAVPVLASSSALVNASVLVAIGWAIIIAGLTGILVRSERRRQVEIQLRNVDGQLRKAKHRLGLEREIRETRRALDALQGAQSKVRIAAPATALQSDDEGEPFAELHAGPRRTGARS